MQDIPKVGIVTVSYNAENHMNGFLSSLIANKENIAHVIFVDNNSHDKTKELITFLDDQISYEIISNDKNIGYSAAVNQGIRKLLEKKCEHIVVTNNDLTIEKGGLRTLVEDMAETHADVVGIPTTNDGITYVLDNSFNKETGVITYNTLTKKTLEEKISFTKTIPSLYVQGGVVLFSRQFFAKIGLYDGALFFGGDELDFLLRILSSKKIITAHISLRAYNLFDHLTHHDGRFKLRKATMMIQGVMYVLLKHGYMPWSLVYENTMSKLFEELGRRSLKRRIALYILSLRAFFVTIWILIIHKIYAISDEKIVN